MNSPPKLRISSPDEVTSPFVAAINLLNSNSIIRSYIIALANGEFISNAQWELILLFLKKEVNVNWFLQELFVGDYWQPTLTASSASILTIKAMDNLTQSLFEWSYEKVIRCSCNSQPYPDMELKIKQGLILKLSSKNLNVTSITIHDMLCRKLTSFVEHCGICNSPKMKHYNFKSTSHYFLISLSTNNMVDIVNNYAAEQKYEIINQRRYVLIGAIQERNHQLITLHRRQNDSWRAFYKQFNWVYCNKFTNLKNCLVLLYEAINQ